MKKKNSPLSVKLEQESELGNVGAFLFSSKKISYMQDTVVLKGRASLVAQRLKRLLPMQETRIRSLGQEDPLEKEMVTHSSILAWRIPWTEKPGRLQSMGSQRVGHD